MATLHLISNGNGSQVVTAPRRDPWALPSYSPTSLNQHAHCPEAFLHERVLKTPPAAEQSSEALAKGAAVHALLQRYVGMDGAQRTLLSSHLEAEAARALVAQGINSTSVGYPAALADVVACAATGFDVLQKEFAGAALLMGEQFLSLNWDKGAAPFRLTAKIDLLAVFLDGSVESLDWKTGAPRGLDQLQNVICRLVTEANVSQLCRTHLPAGSPAAIRTTVCHLGTRKLTTQEFDRTQLVAEFAEIRTRIERIEQAKRTPAPGALEWAPQPGPLCNWCKYAHACSYHASMGVAMPWLENNPRLGV